LQLPVEGASKTCFPQGIVCAAGQACPTGWSCIDFATVKESSLADMWGPTGETTYCFPDVLRGVADKTTKVDSSGINPGNSGGEVSLPPTKGGPDGGISVTNRLDAAEPATRLDAEAPATQAPATADAEAPATQASATADAATPLATKDEAPVKAKSSSSGCALAGHRSAGSLWCLLAGLVAAGLRRRRR
jgi:hypothetical protein